MTAGAMFNLQTDEPRLSAAYPGTVSAAPVRATGSSEEVRQEATLRFLRGLTLALVVWIEVSGVLSHPHPGLIGDGLGVLLALIGVALGAAGALLIPLCATGAAFVSLAVLLSGSMTLVWLQPRGTAILGVYLAVSVAALRLPQLLGSPVVIAGVLSEAFVGLLTGARSLSSTVQTEVGVVAFYVIALLARRLRERTEQSEQLLLELEQSREAQVLAVTLAERQRLAREMHDVLAHSLSGLVLQLEGARLLTAQTQTDGDLSEVIERAHHLAKTGLDEARRAIGLLRDEDLPGPDRLPDLLDAFRSDTGVSCTLDVKGPERVLSSEARLTLYRVAQEALTNVRKHAEPSHVDVHLAYEPNGMRLTVEDSGSTCRPVAPPTSEGYGLTGMRERAELLGGELTAATTVSGFRVELWIPA